MVQQFRAQPAAILGERLGKLRRLREAIELDVTLVDEREALASREIVHNSRREDHARLSLAA